MRACVRHLLTPPFSADIGYTTTHLYVEGRVFRFRLFYSFVFVWLYFVWFCFVFCFLCLVVRKRFETILPVKEKFPTFFFLALDFFTERRLHRRYETFTRSKRVNFMLVWKS